MWKCEKKQTTLDSTFDSTLNAAYMRTAVRNASFFLALCTCCVILSTDYSILIGIILIANIFSNFFVTPSVRDWLSEWVCDIYLITEKLII